MRASVVSLLFVGFVAPFTLAAPTENAKGTVRTPYGDRPADSVHQVPAGGEVRIEGDNIHLVDAHGTILHTAVNDHKKVRAYAGNNKTDVVPDATGWVAYGYWYNTYTYPISEYYASWTVPPAPASYTGQTVFLFNSIEPADGESILQPVIQYGPSAGGGGAYWAAASWFVIGSTSYVTPLTTVSPGQGLQGLIELTAYGSTYNYISEFTSLPNSGLQLTNSEQLVWATQTLEIYNVASAAQLPSGATTFSGINILVTAGVPAVTWTAVSDPGDGISTVVNIQGAQNAEVTIYY